MLDMLNNQLKIGDTIQYVGETPVSDCQGIVVGIEAFCGEERRMGEALLEARRKAGEENAWKCLRVGDLVFGYCKAQAIVAIRIAGFIEGVVVCTQSFDWS
jgi:hypothetical protein